MWGSSGAAGRQCEMLAKNGTASEYDSCYAIVSDVCGAESIVPYFPFHYCTMAALNLEWLSIIVQVSAPLSHNVRVIPPRRLSRTARPSRPSPFGAADRPHRRPLHCAGRRRRELLLPSAERHFRQPEGGVVAQAWS